MCLILTTYIVHLPFLLLVYTSDHYGIQIVPNWKCNADQVHQQQRVIWRYKNADFGRACQLINETDWDSLLPSDDIDLATTNWHNTFIEACISQQTLKKKRNVPWLNKNIIRHIRKRNAAFKATKTSNSLSVNYKYKKLRNKVVMLLRKSKKSYFQKLNPRNKKEFWKAVKFLSNYQSTIPTLHNLKEIAELDKDKAFMFNNFFFILF